MQLKKKLTTLLTKKTSLNSSEACQIFFIMFKTELKKSYNGLNMDKSSLEVTTLFISLYTCDVPKLCTNHANKKSM